MVKGTVEGIIDHEFYHQKFTRKKVVHFQVHLLGSPTFLTAGHLDTYTLHVGKSRFTINLKKTKILLGI